MAAADDQQRRAVWGTKDEKRCGKKMAVALPWLEDEKSPVRVRRMSEYKRDLMKTPYEARLFKGPLDRLSYV